MIVGGESKDRKEQILTEARALFSRLRFRKCTTEDIASACGITKAALYHYFKNKEQIFTEVVNREGSLLIREIRKAVDSRSNPTDRLRAFIMTRFEKIKNLLNLYRISQATGRELLPAAEACRTKFFDQEARMLVSILQEGVKIGEFRKIRAGLVARTVIAAFQGIESYFLLSEDTQTVAEAMQETLSLFSHGLVEERRG